MSASKITALITLLAPVTEEIDWSPSIMFLTISVQFQVFNSFMVA